MINRLDPCMWQQMEALNLASMKVEIQVTLHTLCDVHFVLQYICMLQCPF